MNQSEYILIAEDEVSLQFIMKMMLSEYKIEIVENGKLLVEKAIENPPKLILTDFMMPIMSGEDALIELRKNETTKDIPIVALSAKSQPSEIDAMIKLGFTDYLTKPVRKQHLLDVVKQYMA